MDKSKLRVILVDDEPLARLAVQQALATHPDVEVIAECSTAAEAVEAIKVLHADAMFVDVQMPGPTGIDLLRELPKDLQIPTIFVTAHSEHALNAFDVCATDYIVKPIDQNRFDKALARLRDEVALRGNGAQLHHHAAEEVQMHRLTVRDRERIYVIPTEEIDWLRADGNYVHIHAGRLRVMQRTTLKGVLAHISKPQFLQIHRATAVNVERVAEIHATSRGAAELVLKDGTRLTLSRRFSHGARAALGLT